jgi:hypothetical protein
MAELDIPITVTGLQGRPIATTAPADGQALSWSAAGGVWTPITPPFLPLSGGCVSGNLTGAGTLTSANQMVNPGPVTVQGSGTSPSYVINNTAGPGIAAGSLWRIRGGTGGAINIEMNGAAAGDFSVAGDYLYINPNGNVVAQAQLQAQGGFINSTGTNIIAGRGAVFSSNSGAGLTIGPANTSGLMLGLGSLGCALTPSVSGRVIFSVFGGYQFNNLNTMCFIMGAYGTGTAPVNGANQTGTQLPSSIGISGDTPGWTPWSISFLLNLSIGTHYWMDILFASGTGGSSGAAVIGTVGYYAVEI